MPLQYTRFGTCAVVVSYLCKFETKWHQILDASLSNNPKVACKKTLYNPVSISSVQARLWRHWFCNKRHFELSTGDVIMNIAVSFSLHFAENMLNMSSGSFQSAPASIYRVIISFTIFSSNFLFLNDVFTIINICSICLVLTTRWVILL